MKKTLDIFNYIKLFNLQKIIVLCILLKQSVEVFSQEIPRCGNDLRMPQHLIQNTDKIQAIDVSAQTYHKNSGTIRYIPVAVHVIHNGGSENITDNQIFSQIEILNQDFRKILGTLGDGKGVDTQIEFFLAQKDPNGQCTNGITRHQSLLTNHDILDEAQLKSISHWPARSYLNIYVVKTILGGLTLGYSTQPGQQDSSLSGIVIQHTNFGKVGTVTPPFHLGRTVTHEVGHWLGLLHIFQDGCAGTSPANCSSFGDKICDTPPTKNPNGNTGCPTGINTCVEFPQDKPDMVENYLDYTDDACMNLFTQGQSSRMNAVLDIEYTTLCTEQNLKATGFGGCISAINSLNTTEITINIMPNPATNRVQIFCNHHQGTSLLSLTIKNIYGQIIENMDVSEITNFVWEPAIWEKLPSGIYFVTLTTRNGISYTQKVLKLSEN